jgi:hypothetical protein
MFEDINTNTKIDFDCIISEIKKLPKERLKNILEYNKQTKKMSPSQVLFCILIESKI